MTNHTVLRVRRLAAAVLVACVAVPAYAKTSRCADGTTSKSGRVGCSHHGGIAAPEPKAERPPPGSVMCKDGTTATAASECLHHGGAPEEAAALATRPTARCKDGTFSRAERHRGACAGHDGVAEFLK